MTGLKAALLVAGSLLAATLSIGVAHAALVVGNAATQNVTCTDGVCTATAPDAVLNIGELNALLAAMSVRVVAGEAAQDISLDTNVSWATGSALILDAFHGITVRKTIMPGKGGLQIVTNNGGKGGSLSFDQSGHVVIKKLAAPLLIEGKPYILATSIAQLAANIAASPKGYHALVNDYDAAADSSYMQAPIQTVFRGTFEGLGNTVSNLGYFGSHDQQVGFFATIERKGTVRNLRLRNINLWSVQNFFSMVGGIAGYSSGHITQCSVTGKIRGDFRITGGGIVGLNYGDVDNSWADVEVAGAVLGEVGGLIGNSHGHVSNVYATGRVITGDKSYAGGLIGYFIGKKLSAAYSTGRVSAGAESNVGGFVGINQVQFSDGKVANTYWDVVQSQTSRATGPGASAGITGRTTDELRAGLPKGFSPALWGQKANTNNGLPYLLTTRP